MKTLSISVRKIQAWSWSFLAALLLAGTSGCISTHCVKENAMAHETYDAETGKDEPVPGQPGYYLLLPLTAVADLATSPFQIGYFLYSNDANSAQAYIYNVPIILK